MICVNHSNWVQHINILFLLLRPCFPTCGISLLSKNLRYGGKLISFHSGQLAHDLILFLEKMSTHMIYLMIQEGNWITRIATRILSICLCFGTRILKRINLGVKEFLFNLCTILFVLCQGGGLLVLHNEIEIPIECIHVNEKNKYMCRV
jgi:hypothetical protein